MHGPKMGHSEPVPDFIVLSNAEGKDPLFFGSSVLRYGSLSVSGRALWEE